MSKISSTFTGGVLPSAHSVNSPNLRTGELRLIAQRLPSVASTALPAKTKPAELRKIQLAREALERSLKNQLCASISPDLPCKLDIAPQECWHNISNSRLREQKKRL
jgi:hypothetical protein